MSNYTIAEIGGMCPTQATGNLADGRAYYFRARHGTWTLKVSNGEAPAEYLDWPKDDDGTIVAEGVDSTGGCLDDDEVIALLDQHLPNGVDMVAEPPHYRGHASGVECIQITEHMPFAAGNAAKYVFRRLDKWNTLEDVRKAVWYLRRHITSRIPSMWLHESGIIGRKYLAQVIDNEEPGRVRDFYDALYFDVPEVALTVLLLEVERLEAAGDETQSG